MLHDADLLAAIPDYISLGSMLKATPSEEGGERILYIEASNEDVDHQNEVVLQKALADSAGYFLRHGNIDLSHYTILGPKSGISNFMEYEIGKPVDVSITGRQTFVKAQLYQGESPMAKNANMVWDSLTRQSPPSRWYPSVGGSVLEKSVKLDPKTGDKIAVVSAVRWNNIALDRCPVNRTVPEVSTVPVGVFAKSLGGFVIAKALEASYATDAVGKVGGAAFGTQSLDQDVRNYFDFRVRMHRAIKDSPAPWPSRDIRTYAERKFGLPSDEADQWTKRLLREMALDLNERKERRR